MDALFVRTGKWTFLLFGTLLSLVAFLGNASAETGSTTHSVTVGSHSSGAVVSGFPTLTGTVAGTGEITNVYVNGFPATVTSNTSGS